MSDTGGKIDKKRLEELLFSLEPIEIQNGTAIMVEESPENRLLRKRMSGECARIMPADVTNVAEFPEQPGRKFSQRFVDHREFPEAEEKPAKETKLDIDFDK